ncbi:hypothetical protein GGR52DRAFT_574442 [Hypoxylon sp. FL1284]|nr:hypothetical protein GGR52DRAFT_574442 [Hypoxylon sp. FL1284]
MAFNNMSSWEEGDIAFFKSVDDLNHQDRRTLINNGYVPRNATGHPVIILERSADSEYFLVTTVSAYSSGPSNDFLAPWNQACHKGKSRGAFYAFDGSEKPCHWQQYLRLKDNGSWPKPETSWVYKRNTFVVPASTLREFRRRTRLQMTTESLQYLLRAMAEDQKFKTRWTDHRIPQAARSCASASKRSATDFISPKKCWRTPRAC